MPLAELDGQAWSGAEISFRDQAACRLTTDERNRIQSVLNTGLSQRELARRLHRSASRSAGRSGAGTTARVTPPLGPPDRQAGGGGEAVLNGFTRRLRFLLAGLRQTLTYDQGKGMARTKSSPVGCTSASTSLTPTPLGSARPT